MASAKKRKSGKAVERKAFQILVLWLTIKGKIRSAEECVGDVNRAYFCNSSIVPSIILQQAAFLWSRRLANYGKHVEMKVEKIAYRLESNLKIFEYM